MSYCIYYQIERIISREAGGWQRDDFLVTGRLVFSQLRHSICCDCCVFLGRMIPIDIVLQTTLKPLT